MTQRDDSVTMAAMDTSGPHTRWTAFTPEELIDLYDALTHAYGDMQVDVMRDQIQAALEHHGYWWRGTPPASGWQPPPKPGS